jgi:hypothetical protein
MGIQDRDYMRDRQRKAVYNPKEWRSSPFTPPSQHPSMLVMLLTWVAIAFLLYGGFTWLEARHHAREHPTMQRVVVTGNRASDLQADRAAPQRVTPSEEVISRARVRAERASPQVQYRALAEERQETPAPQTGGTIYLCRAYNGGNFWSQAHCGQHQALIERIVSVPAGLPFQQQVELAEQQNRRTVSTVSTTSVRASGEPAASHLRECKALDARVEQLDNGARQPQSGQMQDWLRGQRQSARDRQFALHC